MGALAADEPTDAKTRKAAKDYAARLRVQSAEGDYVDPSGGKRRLGEVARQWLDEANPSKRESGWTRDEIVIRKHLAPIEDVPIAKVQPKDVRALVASWSESLASRTVHRNYGVLRAIGHRRLTMPALMAEMLAAQLVHRGLTAADADEFVFANSVGEIWDATDWRRRIWQPAAIAAGLGEMVGVEDDDKDADAKRSGKEEKYVGVTPHDLRRTNATVMVGADVDIKTAQVRLGHSDVRMTLEVYARVQAERDQGAADAVAEVLFSDGGLGS